MKRLPLKLGLLVGTALAFVGGTEPPEVAAAPNPCQLEGNCTFKKPLLAFVLDDSTAMNEAFDADSTRWEAATEFIEALILSDNGYVAENFILGLVRFGHDPNPVGPGTTIPGDSTGLVDGVKLDVPWYDANDPANKYIECTNGDAILETLAALPAPLGGAKTGIGAWTKGALQFTGSALAQAEADHPGDMGGRESLLVVLTTGAWTDPTGTMVKKPAAQDPAITAADMWNSDAIPIHVVMFGGQGDQASADALAFAGGTDQALPGDDHVPLGDALKNIIEEVKSKVVAPVCIPRFPRVMVLLDASSSMLNDGTTRAAPGEGSWDLVRDGFTGNDGVFDILLLDVFMTAENTFYFGLSVFGSAGEEKRVVDYGRCRRDNFAWALDPATACVAPNCVDPYAAPPLKWTFQDGSLINPPDFNDPTISHMPTCEAKDPQPQACSGSNTALHLGLQQVASNLDAHRTACLKLDAMLPCNEETTFLNVLITDGAHDSTDAQVSAPLTAMHNAGVVTHVIGFGDALDPVQLDKLAGWGSGNTLPPLIATTQAELEAAFQSFLKLPVFDECCSFFNCEWFPGETGETGDTGDTSDTGAPCVDECLEGASQCGGDSNQQCVVGDLGCTVWSGPVPCAIDETCVRGSCVKDPVNDSTSTTSISTTGETTTGPGFTSSGDDSSGDPSAPTEGTTSTAGTTTDTGETSAGPSETAIDKGCGCDSDGHAPASSLLLLGLLGLRRRRARA